MSGAKPWFVLLLLSCVLAMHGVQASPSPVETHGIPLPVTDVDRPHPEAKASGGHHSPAGNQHNDNHSDHPGGQMCLAMLTMLVLVWALVVLSRHTRGVLAVRPLIRPSIVPVGRPPPGPSLYRLSVLRL